ncbi:MAG: hypothetical protein QMD50_03680 [Patescibacteria group bacterium]|nr:hypothetical protein [Patescibacteria group bacterium]
MVLIILAGVFCVFAGIAVFFGWHFMFRQDFIKEKRSMIFAICLWVVACTLGAIGMIQTKISEPTSVIAAVAVWMFVGAFLLGGKLWSVNNKIKNIQQNK